MDFYELRRLMSQYDAAPTAAAAGIVMTQATTTFLATPHLTAESRFDEPTPKMDDVIAWVDGTSWTASNLGTKWIYSRTRNSLCC